MRGLIRIVVSGSYRGRECQALVPSNLVRGQWRRPSVKVKRSKTGEFVLNGRRRRPRSRSWETCFGTGRSLTPDASSDDGQRPGVAESMGNREQFLRKGSGKQHVDATHAVVDGEGTS